MKKKEIGYIYSEKFILPSSHVSEEKIKELFNQKMYSVILKMEKAIIGDNDDEKEWF